MQQLASSQVEVKPGWMSVALQPVVGVHHPRRVYDAQTAKLRTVQTTRNQKLELTGHSYDGQELRENGHAGDMHKQHLNNVQYWCSRI